MQPAARHAPHGGSSCEHARAHPWVAGAGGAASVRARRAHLFLVRGVVAVVRGVLAVVVVVTVLLALAGGVPLRAARRRRARPAAMRGGTERGEAAPSAAAGLLEKHCSCLS